MRTRILSLLHFPESIAQVKLQSHNYYFKKKYTTVSDKGIMFSVLMDHKTLIIIKIINSIAFPVQSTNSLVII